MIIDLNHIVGTTHPLDVSFPASEIDLDSEDVSLTGDVALTGSIEKHCYEIDVAGDIKAAAEVSCDRCLIPVETSIEISFKIAYVSSEYESREKEMQVGGEDLDVAFLEDDKIDLTEMVREQIILNLSETALCKPDCLGLCQKCGANKNQKRCDCSEREIDPRFKVLENLVKKN